MQILRKDLRYGARMLLQETALHNYRRSELALGIGANTAIFSVVNAVLLRALPYHNSNQLVVLSAIRSGGDRDGLSILEAQDFQSQMRTLEDLTAFQSQSVNVTGGDARTVCAAHSCRQTSSRCSISLPLWANLCRRRRPARRGQTRRGQRENVAGTP